MRERVAAWLDSQRIIVSLAIFALLCWPLAALFHAARDIEWATNLLILFAAAFGLGGLFIIDAILWRLIWALRRGL